MIIDSPLINLGMPTAICLLSALPIIFTAKFKEKHGELEGFTDQLISCYLLVLGLFILILIIVESIEMMGFNDGRRTLFVCSVLLIACLDRLVDLSSVRTTIRSTLINTLHYFVTLLCSIPIIWQLLVHLVPQNITRQSRIMSAIEIVLMLIMLVLGIVSGSVKKKSRPKITSFFQ